ASGLSRALSRLSPLVRRRVPRRDGALRGGRRVAFVARAAERAGASARVGLIQAAATERPEPFDADPVDRPAAADPRSAARRKWLALGLALWAVATAFNVTKAVHIDDTADLAVARQIARDPLHPYGGELNWQDEARPMHRISQPPLLFYVFAAGFRAFGES